MFKTECPRRPRDITKMCHMLDKLICLIFRSEIPHDELIDVVYSFCSDLLLFSRKFAKTIQDDNRYKMADISGPSNNARTLLLEGANASSLFFNLFISVEGIGKLFKPKTSILRLILNSRRVFKNY